MKLTPFLKFRLKNPQWFPRHEEFYKTLSWEIQKTLNKDYKVAGGNFLVHFYLSKNPISKNFIQTFRIVRLISRTKGLTRALSYKLLADQNNNFNRTFEMSRYELIAELLKHRSIVRGKIIERVGLGVLETRNQIQFVKQVNYVDKNSLDQILLNTTTQFELQNFYSLGRGQRNNLRKNLRFILDLVSWDYGIYTHLVSNIGLEKESIEFLKKQFPDVFEDVSRKLRMQYRHTSSHALTIDERLKLPGNEKFDLIHDVEIWHQRFIISDGTLMITDITASPSQSFVAGMWQFVSGADSRALTCEILAPPINHVSLENGIMLSGRCDENWFHFIFDTLSRLVVFGEIDENIPFLVRDDIPKTSVDLLRTLSKRRIVEISLSDRIYVKELYFLSARSVVFDSKPPKGVPAVVFSPNATSWLRDRAISAVPKTDSLLPVRGIAFKRSGGYRNIGNSDSVEKIIDEFDFEIIAPDQDFYKSQVKTFMTTRIFISPGGAALANMVFMPIGSTVIGLCSWRNRDLNLWFELAEILDRKYIEVSGFPFYHGFNRNRRLHSDFYIPTKKLRKILSEVTLPIT